MIKQLLTIIGAILAAIGYGFLKGKKSTKELENEQAAKQIQAKNKVADDISKLSSDERAKLVQKFTRKKL
jgi:hypothetical protein